MILKPSRRSFLLSLAASRAVSHLRAQNSPALPSFTDVTAKSGINFECLSSRTPQKYLVETMPGGVAMLDFDGDGWQDLYFVNGAAISDPMPSGKQPDKSDPRFWNRLYRNNKDGTFTDVTVKAGVKGHSYGMGVAVGDYDNDGLPDIYVTNFGKNILYHNNGDGTFTDVTDKAGVPGGGWSASACFVDYDRDGRLDLIVSRYMVWDFDNNPYCGDRKPGHRAYCHPDQFDPITHLVYHNNGNGTFTDVTDKSGFGKAPGKGLGIAWNDYDLDGWPDIIVANDAQPEQLFHNLQNGTFEEVGLMAGVAYDGNGSVFSGMGVNFEDFTNDGWPDVFIGNLANQKYALFRNVKGKFEYITDTSNVGRITRMHSGWGTRFFDYDNDGAKDLFIAQSHVMDNIELTQPNIRYLEPMLMMRNVDNKFEDVSEQCGPAFKVPQAARGVAIGDLNNDGFLDIVVSVLDSKAIILQNNGNSHQWITINTVGTSSNRDGMGARIKVVMASGVEQYAMVTNAGSYQSTHDKRQHFGLGKETTAKLIEITWPSGVVQKLENVKAGQILTVKEPKKT